MKSHLKIKVYTLATEMTYIRRQENKWKTRAKLARQRQKQQADEEISKRIAYAEANFWSQRWHRQELKEAARTNHLAYGFMKGRKYAEMEIISYGGIKGLGKLIPDWQAIEDTVTRFSKDEPDSRDIMQRFGEWLADAKAWFDGNPARIKQANGMRAAMQAAMQADPEWQATRKRLAEEAKNRQTAA